MSRPPTDWLAPNHSLLPLQSPHHRDFHYTHAYNRGIEVQLLDVCFVCVFRFTGSDGPSGFGFELTFRLKREVGETAPPTWPAELMQGLARYVFQSGKSKTKHYFSFVLSKLHIKASEGEERSHFIFLHKTLRHKFSSMTKVFREN